MAEKRGESKGGVAVEEAAQSPQKSPREGRLFRCRDLLGGKGNYRATRQLQR
jgi:hypothetical protein